MKKQNDKLDNEIKARRIALNFKEALDELAEVINNIKKKENIDINVADSLEILISILIYEGFIKKTLIGLNDKQDISIERTKVPKNFIMLSIEKILKDSCSLIWDKNTLQKKTSHYLKEYISNKVLLSDNNILDMTDSTILNNLSNRNEIINDILNYYKDKQHTLLLDNGM